MGVVGTKGGGLCVSRGRRSAGGETAVGNGWFCYLFNDTLAVVGYLMPKLSLLKTSRGTILFTASLIRGFISFSRALVQK